MEIQTVINHFMDEHLNKEMPVLIGFSGGPDSMALYEAILQYRMNCPELRIGLAHIDHRWRNSSAEEARSLETLAKQSNCQWHLHVLQPTQMEGNQEEACRMARYAYFGKLCKEFGYQAVILGHHQDDQSETILKRLFEGANLHALQGMKRVSHFHGTQVWRPLLYAPKSSVIQYLSSRNANYLVDPTNFDLKYTRAKMREKILPALRGFFGKEISSPLIQIAEDARELNSFTMDLLKPALESVRRGWAGMMGNFNLCPNQHPFLAKAFIRYLLTETNGTLSREQIENAALHLINNSASKSFSNAKGTLWIDRGHVFTCKPMSQSSSLESVLLKEGNYKWGEWIVQCRLINFRNSLKFNGWKAVWEGDASLQVTSQAPCYLSPALPNIPFPAVHKTLGKWWTDNKIPSFLRYLTPVITQNGNVLGDFLAPLNPPETTRNQTFLVQITREQ